MSAGRWLALDPLREVVHVDRLGFIELGDVPKITNEERLDLDPVYRVARSRTPLSDGVVDVCVYHDRDLTPQDLADVRAFVRAA